MEQYMDFEKTVQQSHKPNRVNPEALATLTGTKITSDWKITCKAEPGIVISTVVADLQDYFKVSMNLELAVETAEAPAETEAEVTEEVRYSGTYTGTLTFTIAVNTAEDTE